MNSKIRRIDIFGEKFSDYISPLTVKEIRQSLKGKLFLSSFLIGMVACMVPTMIFAFDSNDYAIGQSAFMAYSAILCFGVCLVFPYLAFSSLHEDRLNSTFELVGITNLSSYQLVLGKWQSSMVQVSLFVSSVLPFMTYSYFLKGISIFSIVIVVVSALLISQVMNLLAILAASLSHLKSNRLTFYFVFVFLAFGFFSLRLSAHFVNGAINGELTTYLNNVLLFGDIFYATGGVLFIVIAAEWFLYELASSQLAPLMANRSSRCRYALTAIYAALLVNAIVFAGSSSAELIKVLETTFKWVAAGILILSVFILGESDELSPALYKKYKSENDLLSKCHHLFFLPGKSSGYLFLITLLMTFFFIYLRYEVNPSITLYLINSLVWLSFIYLLNSIPYNKHLTAPLRRTATIAVIAVLLFFPTMIFLFTDSLFGAVLNIFNPSFFESNSFISLDILVMVNLAVAFILLVICVIKIKRSEKKIQTVRKFDAGERGASQ